MSGIIIPKLATQLAQLIATPSVSCTAPNWDQSNLPVIELLASWLETLHFKCEIMAVPDHPTKANLIATLGSGPGGLVLAGHTDTVPFDEHRWQHNPLALTEADQRFYGLGTSDMKGFFPIAIEAAKQFVDADLKQPLIILATADEESSMSGARALAEAGQPIARYAVIGEPTGMKPVRMHKGMMMQAIRIRGNAGHSSNPALGNSALDAMQEVLAELIVFRSELKRDYQQADFEVSFPTLNLGCIHGGDNPNRICGSCELQFDLRPLPGMQLDALQEALVQRLEPIRTRREIELELVPLFSGIPAHETAADSTIVQAAERLTGHTAISVNFATEAPYLNQLGMQTVVMGPGDIDQAHQPDEYLSMDRIKPTIAILEGLIKEFCL